MAAPLRAIAFMIAAGLINVAMITSVKHLAVELHPFQISFFRCLIGFLVLAPMIWRAGGIATLRSERKGLHLLRGLLNAAGMLAFFWAISLTTLATVSAIAFAAPLFATLLAILILGEKVGLRRWAGLAIGFAGTVIILRPGAGVIGEGALIALASSIVWAGAMIVIKHLTRSESVLSITAWGAFYVGLFTLIPAIFVWKWPQGEAWLWLIFVGACGSAIQLCFAKAFSLADTSVVLPFDFLKLVWASLVGFLLFAEIPDLWTWVGGTIIFASSVYIAYRERRRGAATLPRRDVAATP
jgi:drug/metabolite transporter (DMT)-like permease